MLSLSKYWIQYAQFPIVMVYGSSQTHVTVKSGGALRACMLASTVKDAVISVLLSLH